MSIVSSEAKYGVEQKLDGVTYRSVRYRLVDHNGLNYTVGTRRVGPTFDVDAGLARVVAQANKDLIRAEINKYINSLTDDVDPIQQTKLELRRAILLRILSLDSLEQVMEHIGSVAFLMQATDDQLKSLLSVGNAAIAKLRIWQSQIQTHKQFADNYKALI